MEFTAFTCHFCAERQEWDTPVTNVPDSPVDPLVVLPNGSHDLSSWSCRTKRSSPVVPSDVSAVVLPLPAIGRLV